MTKRHLRAVALLLLVLIAGGITLTVRALEALDDAVVRMSEAAAEHFLVEHHDGLLRAWERGRRQAIRQSVHEVLSDNFVIVEVYDLAARPIVEAVRPGYEAMEQRLSGNRHGFPSDHASAYDKFISDGRLYLQVISPILGAEKQIIGFFEGVYELPEAAQADLLHQLLRQLAALGAGLVAAAGLFWLALRRYRRGDRL